MQIMNCVEEIFPINFLENNSFIDYNNKISRIISNPEEIKLISFEKSKSYPRDKILNVNHLKHLMNSPELIPVEFIYFLEEEDIRIPFIGSLFYFKGYQGSITILSMSYWRSIEMDHKNHKIREKPMFCGTEGKNTYVAVFK